MTPPRSRDVLAAFAALALLVAFFPVFGGKLPVPANNALLLLPEHPAAADVNDELWDVPTQYLPWARSVAAAYRSGRLPFRFAANGSGTSLWANPQAQVLTPTTACFLFLPEAWASAMAAAAKLFAAAIGVFFLLRRFGLSPPAAAWGGLAYGFSLTFTTWLHYPLTYPQAMLPWVLLALDRLARNLPGGFAATLAAASLLLLGGYPEGELFVAVAGATFFLARIAREPTGRLGRIGRALGAVLLAVALSALVTLPQVLAIRGSERSARIARATGPRAAARFPALWSPPAYGQLVRYWVVPEAQGNPRDGDKFGVWSFAGRTSGYAGILVATLAIATFGWRRAPAMPRWARGGTVLLALYILGYPPLHWVLDALPGVRWIAQRATISRASAVLVLLLVVLAALQLDRLRNGDGRGATRAAAVLLLAAVAAVFVEFLRSPERPPLTVWRAASFLLPAVLLLVLLLVLTGRSSPRRGFALVLLAFVGTGADLLRIGARFNSGTAPESYFPVTPSVADLQRASAGGRFASGSSQMSGIAHMYGLEDVSVQDPMTPARYVDVLKAAAGYTGPEQPFASVTRLDAPILDFLNVRARLAPSGDVRRWDTPAAVLPDRLVGCRDDAEVLGRLASAPDFRKTAYAVGVDEAFPGAARVLSVESRRPDEILIRLRSDAARLLALPVSDAGGWTAASQGRALPTLRVNSAFLGVRVPAGDHAVVCRYRPPGFEAGARISAAAAVLLATLALLRWRARLRSRSPAM